MKKPIVVCFIIFTILILGLLMYVWKKGPIVCGLKNHHNVCYINSVIQSLFSCKSFIACLEGLKLKDGSVMSRIQKTWEEMKEQKILDKRPLYKKFANQSGSLFQYDNQPGYTENFLEFIVMNLEKEANAKNLFLNESNFDEQHKLKVFLKKTSRHVVLLSRITQKPDSYIDSIIDYISKKDFILPKILVFSLGSIYKTEPDLKIPNEITVKNTKYQLQSIIFRKRKEKDEGHFYAICKRQGVWFEMNDEFCTEMDNLDFLNTTEGYLLFYEQ